MAEAGEGKKAGTGRKHESRSPKDYYEVQGNELKRRRKSCPRCGEGTWLAKHRNRQYCGKCGYTVFEGKNAAPAAEVKEGKTTPAETAKE